MDFDEYSKTQAYWHSVQTPISETGLTGDVAAFFKDILQDDLPGPKKGLVIGAGLGVELGVLATIPGSEWTCTDIIDERISYLRGKGYDCHKADMHDMPMFGDNAFDTVFSCHSMEHAHTFSAVFSEFIRISRSGGLVLIAIPDTEIGKAHFTEVKDADHFRSMTPPELEESYYYFDERDNTNVFVFINRKK